MNGAVVLLGDGGQADEIASFLPPGGVAGRAVTRDYLRDGLVDAANPPAELLALPVIAAVGLPAVRRLLVEAWPGDRYARVLAEGSWVSRTTDIGEGSVVAPGAVITAATIGRHGLVNVGASLAHDVVAGDFVTVGPGARVGGAVRLGDGVFVGIGAVVIDRVTLAAGVVVGAGAVVVADIDEPGAVVVGNPARVLRVDRAWAREA
jgi:carbonic anhydrase/acetyltransferase-like protein (isoleucine patch superfamily)